MNRQTLWTLARLTPTLLLALQASTAPCQDQHAGHATGLPILANGAEAPDSIPDHLAYAHFIMSVTTPDAPSAEQASRRDMMLQPVRFSKEDHAAFIAALRGIHTQLAFIDRETQRLAAAPGGSESRLVDLKLQRTGILSEAQTRLTTRLSPDGLARLDKYIVEQVKPRIIVYGEKE